MGVRKLAPFILITLIELTAPSGAPIYIVAGSVADITKAIGGGANAQVRTTGGTTFVRETPAEVAKKVRDAN